MRQNIKWLILLILFVFSCKQNERINFPITELNKTQVLSDTLNWAKIVEGCYTDIFTVDSLLILIARCDSDYIHIYNKYTLQFFKKIGKKGNAPHEFARPVRYNSQSTTSNNSSIIFFDTHVGYNKCVDFQKIMSNVNFASCVDEKAVDTELLACHNINLINDNTVAMQSIDVSEGIFMLYNPQTKNKKWVDYYPIMNFENKREYISVYYGSIHANVCKDRIVYASRHFDEILFFDINGKLISGSIFSMLKRPIIETKFKGVSHDSEIFFLSMCSTKQLIYILRVNQSTNQLIKEPKTPMQIVVFDWEGTLHEVYELNIFPHLFYVDEDSNTLYVLRANSEENDFTSEIFMFALINSNAKTALNQTH